MKIALITIGKTRESYLIDAINDYVKRISHYNKIDLFERGHSYETLTLDKRFPKYILENIEKFKEFIIKTIL